MQKKEQTRKRENIFTPKRLAVMALMIALSIVLGKYLAINVTTMIRISLENLPIILSAIILGPLAGGIVALVADLLGCILVGYEINPIVTIGAVTIGVVCGLMYKYFVLSGQVKRVALAVGVAHLLGSVLIKTSGLAAFYLSSYDMGLGTLLLIRLVTYILTSVVEVVIIQLLLRSKATKSLFDRIGAKK